MFRNQYLVTDSAIQNIDTHHFIWNNLYIYLGPETSHTFNDSCLIIGKAVTSLTDNKKLIDIANDLKKLRSTDDKLKYLDHIVGRYVIFLKEKNDFIVLTDACAFKRALFMQHNNIKLITSSENFAADILNITIDIDKDIASLMIDALYKKNESPWFGMTSFDSRFNFIIPNHYLKWSDFSLSRMLAPLISLNSETTNEVADMLHNTIRHLAANYKLIQPVTAGVDSRMLLAASRSVKEKIIFYVFGDMESNHEDVRIPKELSTLNDTPVYIHSPILYEGDIEFKSKYLLNVLGARLLPKTGNIYYHFKNTSSNYVNLNGNGAEIFRSYYGISHFNFGPNSLAILSSVNKWPLLKKRIGSWYKKTNALAYAKDNKISTTDLFYWEQRMAIWGSMYPLEQDIAIDEISPFSNRKLIFTMLSESKKRRAAPTYLSSMDVIHKLNPKLNSIPINPDSSSSKIRTLINKYTLLLFIVRKLKDF